MIDFIKLSIKSYSFAQSLRSNINLVKSYSFTSSRTLTNRDVYTYRGLQFCIYNTNRIEIQGSLHKYFNGGRHNHNAFSFADLEKTVFELCDLFGNEFLNCEVNNLEYGLNINPSFHAMDYVNSLIVYHSKGIREKNPITRNDVKGFDKGVRFTLNQYELKLYYKSQQYNDAKANTLRIEFKTRKMEIIEDIGINVLADLLDRSKIAGLHKMLLKLFPGCISREGVCMDKLSPAEQIKLLEAESPNKWIGLNSYEIRKKIACLNEIQTLYGTTNRKQEVYNLLNEKYKGLISHSDIVY